MTESLDAHPVADLIQALLEEGTGTDPIVLSDDSFETLADTIDHYVTGATPELMHVAETVYSVADWLEEKRSFETAAELCALLDRPTVLGAMRAIIERLQSATIEVDAAIDFKAFSSTTPVRAPAVDAEPPIDSVKAGHLFPRRL